MIRKLLQKMPQGWAVCTIEKLVPYDGLFTDGDWVESKDQNPEGNVRLIQLADIGDGHFVDKSNRFLTKKSAYNLNCTFLKKNDLLVARMPDPLGRTCLFPFDEDESYVTVVDVCAIRLGNNSAAPKFLMHLINSSPIRLQIEEYKTGSTRKRISRKNLARVQLPIPPLHEQRRIVAKIEELFSELDNGIENLKTAREQLKIYRQAVLKHAFEGKLTADWREQNKDRLETTDQLLARIRTEREARFQQQLTEWKAATKAWEDGGKQDKKPGKPRTPEKIDPLNKDDLKYLAKLPYGWAWFKVGNICDVVRGGSPRPAGDKKYYDGDIPFLKVADLTRNSGVYLDTFSYTIKEAGLQKTRFVGPNTLMISNSGATLGVPKICLINATFNDGIAAFLGLRKDEQLYHHYFWLSKTAALRNINQGAAQPNLNTDLLKETFIPICSLGEMEFVAEQVEKSLSVCDQFSIEVEAAIRRCEALRQSILKKAFSGQLVAQDPNDEPAAVLLERIKAEKAAQASPTKIKRKKSA